MVKPGSSKVLTKIGTMVEAFCIRVKNIGLAWQVSFNGLLGRVRNGCIEMNS